MGSLTGCLAKAGKNVSRADKDAIMARAKALRDDGTAAADAARLAVDEQIAAVRALIAAEQGKRAAPAEPVAAAAPAAAAEPEAPQSVEASPEEQQAVAPLYASRPLTPASAEAIRAWAASQGFKTTLPAADMHVTVAYSREPVDGAKVPAAAGALTVPAGKRTVEPLGDQGAVVLKFESAEMLARWKQYRDTGASWDYEGYTPHVTLTYDGKGVDLDKVQPYTGPIELAAETQEPLNVDKADDYKEAGEDPTPQAAADAPAADVQRPKSESVTPSAAEKAAPAARLTDAGEELIRNRRGKLKGLAWDDVSTMNDTLKVAQVVKANVWPRPDYAKMVEEGAPAWKAAALKAVYDKLAAAPVTRTTPTDSDLRAYIETMQQVREALTAELDRVAALPDGAELWKTLSSRNVFGKVFPIPADARPVYGAPSPFDRVSEQGKENNRRALLIGGDAAVQALQFNHKVLSKVKDLLADGFPAKQESWQKSWEVRQTDTRDSDVPEAERTGQSQQRFYVYEKGSRWRLAKGGQDGGYATQEQAEAFARSLTAKKRDALPPSWGLDLADATRTGPDWRNGKDVTAEQVMSHFGFRGVNLGEYVKAKQGVAQMHLNHVYDAFSDLADLLGVPPKAMSLNGTLGVAVGAQGSGKALAHFVPGVNEINITRDSGAGALAHEFGHAVDHYFATQHGRAASMAKRPYLSAVVEGISDTGGVRPEVMGAMRVVMKTLNSRPMTEPEARKFLTDQRELNQRRMDRWVKEFSGNKGADPAALAAVAEKLKRGDIGEAQDTDVETNLAEFMRAAGLKPGNAIAGNAFSLAYRLRDLADEARFLASHIPQVDTDYSKASAAMDAKKQGDGYWSTPWEKFARAFETFAMDALKDRQRESLYLSGLVDSAAWQSWSSETGKAIPYPAGAERLEMQQAFQKLVDTIQTRTDEAGNVAMFSRTMGDQSPVMQALSENDELFALPRLTGQTVSEIAFGLDPTIKVTSLPADKGRERWRVTLANGTHGDISIRKPNKFGPDVYGFDLNEQGESVNVVTERPGDNPDDVPTGTEDVFIDVSTMKTGQGGNQVYAIAGALAHNTGRMFIGDPNGLSDTALRRRAENMLSLALRYGTTDFLAPHPDQIKGSKAQSVPPLQWVYGDDEGNAERLVALNVKAMENAVPALANWDFDANTGQYVGRDGRRSLAGFLGAVTESRRQGNSSTGEDLGRAQAAGRTAARAVVLRALSRQESGGAEGGGQGRNGVLDRLGAAAGGPASRGLTGVFKRGTNGTGLTADALQAMAAQMATAGVSMPINVAQSVDDLPAGKRQEVLAKAPDGSVRGIYFRYDDQVWVVADNIRGADEFTFVVLHEAFHRGLAKTIPEAKPVLQMMYRTNQALRKATAQQMKRHGIGQDEAIEEALADMAGEGKARDLRGWDKLLAAVRNWLNKVSRAIGAKMVWTDDMVADFVAGMTRQGLTVNAGVMPVRGGVEVLNSRAADPDIRFSRTPTAAAVSALRDAIPPGVQEWIADRTVSQRGFNRVWHRTVGTQLHKAKINKDFGRVYNAVQDFMKDVSRIATLAAQKAPDMLPQVETLGDLAKLAPTLVSPAAYKQRKADIKAASDAMFDGTLRFKRDEDGAAVRVEPGSDELGGLVWTDAELRERGVSERGIKMYRQSRAAIDQSLDNMLAADLYRQVSVMNPEMVSTNETEYAALLADLRRAAASDAPMDAIQQIGNAIAARLDGIQISLDGQPNQHTIDLMQRRQDLRQLQTVISDKVQRIQDLKTNGYAPLMRFGPYAVDVVGDDGRRMFFGLYESQAAANKAARNFRGGGVIVSQSVVPQKDFEALQGVSPETAMLFAEMLGVEKNEAMQAWLKNAVAEQSALKRHIRRKGIEGFDEDGSRVLAAFLTSNARAASRALHSQRITDSVESVQQGDVKDEARALADYVNNPKEEAQAIRSLLFIQYIGGSIASAIVNLTQTLVQTLPYLSQYGGAVKAGTRISAAMKLALADKIPDPKLAAAVERAEKDGVIKPQEVFQLQAETSRSLGSNLYARSLLAAWGSMFQLAEQFNRRVAFIAAYNTATQQGLGDPFKFAENAVDETQSVFNKGNRPSWSRGAVGATLFTFKTFTIQYIEFLKRLATAGEPGSVERRQGQKAAALALVMLILLSGMKGLPFADDADDLIDTLAQALGYNWINDAQRDRWLDSILGEVFSDIVQHGLNGIPGVPFDVSQRLGMANLLPGTGLLKRSETRKQDQVLEVFGVAGSAVRDATQSEFRPLAIRNLAKGIDTYQNEMYRDTRGRKVTEADAVDAVLKAIGLQPNKVARAQREIGRQIQQRSLYQSVKEEITDAWAQARFENDADGAKQAQQALQRWNESNPDARIVIRPETISGRVRQMRLSKAQRTIANAPRPLRAQTAEALQ